MRGAAFTLLLFGAAVARAAPPPQGPMATPNVTSAPVVNPTLTSAPVAAAAPAVRTPTPPSRALIEKLGAGDRAWLSGDYRTALFAYQDAVYLDPTSAVARIRLARAYQALRHGDEARHQLTQAIELDPDNAEARRLLEGLKAAPATGAPGGATPAPKIYKLSEEETVSAAPQGPRSKEPAIPAPAAPVPGR